MSRTKVENLTPEMHEKWTEFVDLVNEAVEHVFDASRDKPAVVIGMQFGEMGKAENLPTCIGTSNLPICMVPQAVRDLAAHVDAAHEDAHEQAESNVVSQEVEAGALSPEAREYVEKWAEMFGVKPEDIKVFEAVDASDLNALPETETTDETPEENA